MKSIVLISALVIFCLFYVITAQVPSYDDGLPPPSGDVPSEECSIRKCYSDVDCGRGKCFGIGAGQCQCLSCFQGLPCGSDRQCGGLVGACDTSAKRCECFRTYKSFGFENMWEITTGVCGKRCDGKYKDTCYGLKCTPGLCTCENVFQFPKIFSKIPLIG